MGKKRKRIPVFILDICELGILDDSLWRLHIELWLISADDGTLPDEEVCCRRLRRDLQRIYPLFAQLVKRGLVVRGSDGILVHRMARAQYEYKREHAARYDYGPNWHLVRERVLERDSHACRYCGDPATHVDHVIPMMQDGTSDPSNLVASCAPCNLHKGGRTPKQAGMELMNG